MTIIITVMMVVTVVMMMMRIMKVAMIMLMRLVMIVMMVVMVMTMVLNVMMMRMKIYDYEGGDEDCGADNGNDDDGDINKGEYTNKVEDANTFNLPVITRL